MSKHLLHVKSRLLEENTNSPKKPMPEQINYGEIAINYKKGYETIFIKNDNNEIVPFYNGKVIDSNEEVVSNALNDLDGRLTTTNTNLSEIDERLTRIERSQLIEKTYSEMVSAVSNESLIPGEYYRITDYVTTTTQVNTQSAGHPFDIIVLALSENRLSENAHAIRHDGDTYFSESNLDAWILKYCLPNDVSRFTWADVTNGKGVIYYMKDEWDNECAYDFKNIQYVRKITDGKYDTEGTSTYVYTFTWFYLDESTDQYLAQDASIVGNNIPTQPTRPSWVAGVHDNVIKPSTYKKSSSEYPLAYQLSNNAFISNADVEAEAFSGVYDNFIGYNSADNTFGHGCSRNVLMDGCLRNVLGDKNCDNILHDNCSSNSFELECYRNELSADCSNNKFERACSNNKFGSLCRSNLLGSFCWDNTFGNQCSNNSFLNVQGSTSVTRCERNTLFDGCTNNTFHNSSSRNVLLNGCNYIFLQSDCEYNFFGNDCNYIELGGYSKSNSFSNNCKNNTFGDYCTDNNFSTDCHDNTFGSYCSNNELGSGCSHNAFGNHFSHNNVGTDVDYNIFLNYMEDNTIGDGVNNVEFEMDYVYNVVIQNGNGGLTITTTKTTGSNDVIRNFTIAQGVNNAVINNYIGYDKNHNNITRPGYDNILYGKVDYYTYENKNDNTDLINEKKYNSLTDKTDYNSISIDCIAVKLENPLLRFTNSEYARLSEVAKNEYGRYVKLSTAPSAYDTYISESRYNNTSAFANYYEPIEMTCVAVSSFDSAYRITQDEYNNLASDGKSDYYLYLKNVTYAAINTSDATDKLTLDEYNALDSQQKGDYYRYVNTNDPTAMITESAYNALSDSEKEAYTSISEDGQVPITEVEYNNMSDANKKNCEAIFIVNKSQWKTISHNTVNDTFRTLYQDSNSSTVNV